MEDWQQRVIDELSELRGKMIKLEQFLLRHNVGELPLLELQLSTMLMYARILDMRIGEWE